LLFSTQFVVKVRNSQQSLNKDFSVLSGITNAESTLARGETGEERMVKCVRSKKVFLCLAIFIFAIVLVSGCGAGTQTVSGTRLESGVLDEQYRGVPNPKLNQVLKVSDEKLKIDLMKNDSDSTVNAGQGGADEAKPKI